MIVFKIGVRLFHADFKSCKRFMCKMRLRFFCRNKTTKGMSAKYGTFYIDFWVSWIRTAQLADLWNYRHSEDCYGIVYSFCPSRLRCRCSASTSDHMLKISFILRSWLSVKRAHFQSKCEHFLPQARTF